MLLRWQWSGGVGPAVAGSAAGDGLSVHEFECAAKHGSGSGGGV